MIKNKRILVTGGAGSIGSELVRQLAPNNKIFILDINETGAFILREELKNSGHWVHSRTGDVRNKDTLFDVFSDFKPQVVIHCAALKHVTPNNEYPKEAFSTNVDGTINVAEEAKKWECLEKFLFISTDKVVNAYSIMGISKLAAESYIRLQQDRFVAVRFGNVLGSRGSVLEIWKQQFESGEPLTITHPDMERYTMSVKEACALSLQALEDGDKGELYILDMGKPKKIVDLKDEIYGKEYPFRIVGLRKGETMGERLMTDEEAKVAIKKDKYYILK